MELGGLHLVDIIGRHDIAWSLKSIQSSQKPVALEGTEETEQLVD